MEDKKMDYRQVKEQGKITKIGFLLTVKAKGHYKELMSNGHLFPMTRAQAIEFYRHGTFGILGMQDVELIENFLGKYEKSGKYQYTKAKNFVRFLSYESFRKCLKAEFNF